MTTKSAPSFTNKPACFSENMNVRRVSTVFRLLPPGVTLFTVRRGNLCLIFFPPSVGGIFTDRVLSLFIRTVSVCISDHLRHSMSTHPKFIWLPVHVMELFVIMFIISPTWASDEEFQNKSPLNCQYFPPIRICIKRKLFPNATFTLEWY